MGGIFLPLLVIFLLFAVAFQEPSLITLVYLLVGVYALGHWWASRAITQLRITRNFEGHAFLGETIKVSIRIKNAGWLPVGWLRLQESLPVELTVSRVFQRAFSLGANEEIREEYQLQANKRGYYRVGPAQCESGDLFGFSNPSLAWKETDHLTVFPNILPMPRFSMPSSTPMGTLRSTQPIHEDPTRTMGKREYHSGDSMRRIDWKSSAAAGRLQVKLFEPSQSLETMVILGMHEGDYDDRTRADASELAVVTAASVANWVIQKRQSAGLVTNGSDPLGTEGESRVLLPRKGRGHMMRILEILARVQISAGAPLDALIRMQAARLAWGTTLAVMTGIVHESLFDSLLECRRHGHNPVLFVMTARQRFIDFQRRAKRSGITVYEVRAERDLPALRG
jgi:uncharacterized protein (DUF58 family)